MNATAPSIHTKLPKIISGHTPASEDKSACGIGFIATMSGIPSHSILTMGLRALQQMEHRGGQSPIADWERLKGQYEALLERHDVKGNDAKTNYVQKTIHEIGGLIQDVELDPTLKEKYTTDGRGVMVEVDQDIFKPEYASLSGQDADDVPNLAVGSFFLPRNSKGHSAALQDIVTEELKAAGYDDAVWRDIPIDESVLGQGARLSRPDLKHLLIPQKDGVTQKQFEDDLYFIRKNIEKRAEAYCAEKDFSPEGADDFYIPSMSSERIVYKSLSTAEGTKDFHKDFSGGQYKTRFAIPHSRYSTNTFPAWPRAHAYRHIAHNGEINSLLTNINMIGRIERVFGELFDDDRAQRLLPIIQSGGTDSAILDNVVEYLLHAGISPEAVKMILIPEAFEQNNQISDDIRSAYEFIDFLTQPFDGPNTMAMAATNKVVIGGDRSGLRPNRAKIFEMDNGERVLSVLSEDMDLGEAKQIKKWNQEPGEMISIDLDTGHISESDELKASAAAQLEALFDVENLMSGLQSLEPQKARDTDYDLQGREKANDLKVQQRLSNLMLEHQDALVHMASSGKEPIGSMGDDAGLAVTSPNYRTSFNFFQQYFAQVTNPPKDTIRERADMSLTTYIGSPIDSEGRPNTEGVLKLESPIVTNATFGALTDKIGADNIVELSMTFDANGGDGAMEAALRDLAARAEEAAKQGKQIVLTHEGRDENLAAIPSLMAVGAVNTHLLKTGDLRNRTSLNVRAADVWESHDFAALIGMSGADTVNAYMAEETLAAEHEKRAVHIGDKHSSFGPKTSLSEFTFAYSITGDVDQNKLFADRLANLRKDKPKFDQFFKDHTALTLEELAVHENDDIADTFKDIMGDLKINVADVFAKNSVDVSIQNYIKASEGGLLKILGKFGVSHISSYRGGKMFEALGMGQDVIDLCFPGVPTPIKGLSLNMMQERELEHHNKQLTMPPSMPIQNSGRLAERSGSHAEPHQLTTKAISLFQEAVKEGNYETYKEYSAMIKARSDKHRFAVRHWLDFNSDREAIEIDKVEPASEIVKRFFTGPMSLGALGEEAHETLAIAMNRLGAKSSSGEGGQQPERNGTESRSAVKQVASGRFGVDLDYLLDADEIEIKIAQGAKPGEGGQLPGKKNFGIISITRRTKEGVELVSPPPHHDIYSIEDLEQLIHDLHAVNPDAKVKTKLVSTNNLPTVANGVAKAHSDTIGVSGYDGGTGAAAQGSILHAGMPWEVSLNRVQRSLILDHLREKVKVAADSGLKTGRDIVIAAMMGGEEFGYGLMALVAEGCVLARTCQNGDCPVDVARVRKEGEDSKFVGTPEMVENMMMFIAEDVREELAKIGYKSIEEIVGRPDLLKQVYGEDLGLDVSEILGHSENPVPQQKCELAQDERNEYIDPQKPNRVLVDEEILAEHKDAMLHAIKTGESFAVDWDIDNEDRSAGGRLSAILRKDVLSDPDFGRKFAAKEDSLTVNFNGVSAGQTLGLALMEGITLKAHGANCGVGKSLSGGKIVLSPREIDDEIIANSQDHNILGNAALYGSQWGQLYAAGRAGNRFGELMHGGEAVIEGAGSHACNYMTGGSVAILGSTGQNFGAGMSDGQVFVLDSDNSLINKAHEGAKHKISAISNDADKSKLHSMVSKHFNETGSLHAKRLLENWEISVNQFKVVNGATKKAAPELKVA